MNYPREWEKHPYLRTQLLSYLGNKRKLLPFLYRAFQQTGLDPRQTTFVDLFAGSGVVSRLAKMMEFHTLISNDWEAYSYVTQALYLCENPQSLKELFGDKGGLGQVLEELNALRSLKGEEAYVSRYYAPQNLSKFDPKRERLFYTPENALKIDVIRNTIERWYPSCEENRSREAREKKVLLALLVHEASVHTNTGGVFKAYYKEFGGYGHHALKRILSPIELPFPVVIGTSSEVRVEKGDAIQLAKNLEYKTPHSLVYLDPPYNVHQYGSNYHLLNTLVLWDRVSLEDSYSHTGELLQKAGIRKDWKKTHSPFCSKITALQSFRTLIRSISADVVMISYSTDGLIPFSDMVEILSEKGEVNVLYNSYVKYPGGKKSLTRANRNVEYILWVDTRKLSSTARKEKILDSLNERRLKLEIAGLYKQNGEFHRHFSTLEKEKGGYAWKKYPQFIFWLDEWGDLSNSRGLEILSSEARRELALLLEDFRCRNKKEELDLLFAKLNEPSFSKGGGVLWKKIYRALRHLAHPKNHDEFMLYYERGESFLRDIRLPENHSIYVEWKNLGELFQKRN